MPHSQGRRARSLPVVTRGENTETFKIWERTLRPLTQRIPTLKAPWNVAALPKRGGILITWTRLDDADGYEVLRSTTGNFDEGGYVAINLGSSLHDSYFDALGGSPATRYYKVRATSGSVGQPQSVKGILSGVVSAASLDVTDTPANEAAQVAVYDTTTTDSTQTRSGEFIEL